MKNNDIRKNVILVLTFFLSFLLYSNNVYAQKEVGIGDNGLATLTFTSDIASVSCSIEGDTDYYTLTKSSTSLNYFVTTSTTTDAKRATVNCNYTSISGGTGYKNYTFVRSDTIEIGANNVIYKNIYMQFHNSYNKILSEAGLYNVSNVQIEGGNITGDGYTVTSEDNDVVVRYTDTHYSNKIEEKDFKVSYEVDGVYFDVTIKLIIDFNGYIRLYPGNYGTCDMSGWEYDSANRSYKKAVDSNGSVTMPSCSNNSDKYENLELEFKGWALGDIGYRHTLDSSQCEPYVKYQGGQTATPQTNEAIFYTCYSGKKLTSIYLNYGTINDSNWTHKSGSHIYVYTGDSDSITLPSISGVGDNLTFSSYINKTTGEKVDAGSTVSNDGTTYNTIFYFTSNWLGYDDYMRDVSVKENVIFSLSGKTINSCSTSSEAVSVSESGGQCIIKGVSSTNGEYSAIVTVEADDGNTYTVKVAVSDLGGSGNGGPGVYTFNPGTGSWINESTGKVLPGTSGADGQTVAVSNSLSCTYRHTSTDVPNNKDNATSSFNYFLSVTCGNETETNVPSMCLDPGKKSPSYEEYVLDYNLDDSTSGHTYMKGTVLNIINQYSDINDLKNVLRQTDNKTRYTYNVAVRLADYLDNGCSGYNATTGGTLEAHNFFFEDICKDFREGKTLTNSSGDESWLADASTVNSLVSPYGSGRYGITAPSSASASSTISGKTTTTEIQVDNVDESKARVSVVCPEANKCTLSGGSGNYTITYTGDQTVNESNFGLKIKYTTSGSAQVLKPVNSVHQRLIILGESPTYFISTAGKGTCPSTFTEWASSYREYSTDCCAKYNGTAEVTSNQDNKDLFNKLCNSQCVYSNLSNVCNITNTEARDTFTYSEGKDESGQSNYGGCSIYTESGRLKTSYGTIKTSETYQKWTSYLNDVLGNHISKSNYDNNRYCRYTCVENWTFSFEGYSEHVGKNSTFAGAYFTVNNDVYLSNETNCMSTYIDYEKYSKDMETLTNIEIAYYNQYSEASLLLYNLDYGTGTEGEDRSNEDNHINLGDDTCYYYGNYVEYDNAKDCGWGDWSSWGSPSHESSGMDDNTYPTEQWEVDTYTATSDGAELPTYSCPDGGDLDGTTCTRERTRSANTCYGLSGHDGFNNSVSTDNASDAIGFTCNNYKVIASSGNANNKFEQYINNTVTTEHPETSANNTYFTVDSSKYGNTGTMKVGSNNLEDTPNETFSESYSFNTGSQCTFVSSSDGWGDSTKCASEPDNTDCGSTDGTEDICQTNGSSPGGKRLNKDKSIVYEKLIKRHIYTPKTSKSSTSATTNPYKWDNYDPSGLGSYGSGVSDTLHNIMNTTKSKIDSINNKVIELAKQFDQCQNTVIYNNSGNHKQLTEPSSSYSSGAVKSSRSSLVNVSGTSNSLKEISVAYDPKISYTYDESGYMKQVDDSKLYENLDGYGHLSMSSGTSLWWYKPNESSYNSNYTGYCDSNNSSLCVYVNKVTDEYYASDNGWSSSSTEGKAYSNGSNLGSRSSQLTNVQLGTCYATNDENWSGKNKHVESKGVCDTSVFSMYKINYNKLGILNGAFYSNSGLWLNSKVTDLRSHQDLGDTNNVLDESTRSKLNSDAKSAITSAASSFNEDETNVKILGMSHNVFPIRYDTPRDMYQYAYSLGDIGTYSDGTLGRIIGAENSTTEKVSVLENNTYSCFYEVQEQFCQCCGAKIETSTSSLTDVETSDVVQSVYDMSEFNSSSYTGDLGYYVSSVSLDNLEGQKTNLLNNWGTNKIFFLTKDTGVTSDRGQVLQDYIESLGDNVYTENTSDPDSAYVEYSYTLTPSVIAELRNTSYKYGVVKEEVETADDGFNLYNCSTCNADSSSASEKPNNLYPSFTHLRSLWLEETAADFVTDDYKTSNYTKRSGVCLAEDESDLKSLRKSTKCRWIDWLDDDYRSAFK